MSFFPWPSSRKTGAQGVPAATSRRRRPTKRPPIRRLTIEQLEARTVPAVVNWVNASGGGWDTPSIGGYTMSRLATLVIVALFVTCPAVGRAQTFRPIGEQYRDVSAVLQKIAAKSIVYLPLSKDDKQLFYIPFFAMKAGKDDKLEVAVQIGTTPTTKIVSVWLLLSPQNGLEAIAAYIRAQEAITSIDKRFADVQPSQLVGIPFANLDVVEEEPRIGFRQVRLTNYAAQGEIQLNAEVPAADAEKIADDLREKKRLPVFTVQYDLSARKTISQSEIQADLRFFSETKAAKTLLGAPKTSEKFGWKVGPGGVQLEQPFLTRDQRGTFEGRMKAEVKVLIQLEDDRDLAFLGYMQGYFDKVFQRFVFDIDKTPLGQQLANMSAFDFDPKDLSPQQIDQMVADVKNFFSQENANENTFEAGASASFLGIGGSGSVKTSGKTLRKSMEDKGWKFEPKGKFLVPKSFEVHVVDSKTLKTEGVLSLVVLRTERMFARFNHRVSAANTYYPQTIADHLVAFEILKGQVKQISESLATVNKNLSGRIKGLEDNPLKVGEFSVALVRKDQKNAEAFTIPVGLGDDKTTHWHKKPFGARVVAAIPIFNEVPGRAGRLRTLDTVWKGNQAGIVASYWPDQPYDFYNYVRVFVFYYDK
jgi:hypothetical protein